MRLTDEPEPEQAPATSAVPWSPSASWSPEVTRRDVEVFVADALAAHPLRASPWSPFGCVGVAVAIPGLVATVIGIVFVLDRLGVPRDLLEASTAAILLGTPTLAGVALFVRARLLRPPATREKPLLREAYRRARRDLMRTRPLPASPDAVLAERTWRALERLRTHVPPEQQTIAPVRIAPGMLTVDDVEQLAMLWPPPTTKGPLLIPAAVLITMALRSTQVPIVGAVFGISLLVGAIAWALTRREPVRLLVQRGWDSDEAARFIAVWRRVESQVPRNRYGESDEARDARRVFARAVLEAWQSEQARGTTGA